MKKKAKALAEEYWANRICKWFSELLNGKPMKYDDENKWYF